MKPRMLVASTALLVLSAGALGQVGPQKTGPDAPLAPARVPLPRNLTPAEAAYLRSHPLTLKPAIAAPPPAPLHCAGEYEPMQAIVVSWLGTSAQNTVLAQMGAQITTVGNADYYVVVGSAATQTSATTALTSAGANMSRVKFFTRTLDSIWIRDYGPRYDFEGDCRVIIDHTYNRPRPNDDAFNQWFGPNRKHGVYDIPLIHGGGNFHLSALGDSWATQLIQNENPSLTPAQIIAHWQNYQNVATTITLPFATALDSTQHIDMWMQVFGDRKVMLSDWPVKTTTDTINADAICDSIAAQMAAAPYNYSVYRVPARQVGGVHYTYTNVVACNDLLLIPSYTNATIVSAGYNAEALTNWKAAWGDDGVSSRKVVQLACQSLVTSAGVMHCIVQHIPLPRGGVNPTAHVKYPNGGETLAPASNITLRWNTDDDVAVSNVDILLSTDGGATFPITIASAVTPYTGFDGNRAWTVPDLYSTRCRVKVVARDASGNTGSDISDLNFTINGSGCPSDYNVDGFVSGEDFDAFVEAFIAGDPGADFDGNNFVNGDDFDGYVEAFVAGC